MRFPDRSFIDFTSKRLRQDKKAEVLIIFKGYDFKDKDFSKPCDNKIFSYLKRKLHL